MIFTAPYLNLEDESDGAAAMRGAYQEKPIRTALLAKHGERCIILLDPDSSEHGAFQNLFCIERDGGIIWIATLPETHDRFVQIRMRGNDLIANSWSGYMVTINPLTGRTIDIVFVK
jgi:hypothetical protein